MSPTNPDALTGLGVLLAENGDLSRAEQVLRRAVAAHPSDAAALFDLAIVLERSGRREEAAAAYRRLTGDPSVPPPVRMASQRRLSQLGL